jgi:hypothetical protein
MSNVQNYNCYDQSSTVFIYKKYLQFFWKYILQRLEVTS